MTALKHPGTEYTITHPNTSISQIDELCKLAVENNAAAVCVPPLFVKRAKELLAGSGVHLAAVVGFPYGYSVIEAKLAEMIMAMVDGADELDVVINFTALKNNDWQYLAKEITTILPVAARQQKLIKLVIETALLSNDEIIKCCDIYGVAGVPFVSLSTGTAAIPSAESVRLVRKHLAAPVKIKLTANFSAEALMQEYSGLPIDRLGCVIR